MIQPPAVNEFRVRVPILETSRLRLRAHEVKDFSALAKMWSDPEVVRYTIGTPSTEQRSWLRMMTYLGHWSLLGYGYWAVAIKESDEFIGELGFADFKREIASPYKDRPELGWALAPHAHGRGYATEALRAALVWGDANFGDPVTTCLIYPENAASLKVAAKLGYQEAMQLKKNGETEILFTRNRG